MRPGAELHDQVHAERAGLGGKTRVSSVHKDAVVSLNTVLGDAGVLNNPSRVVAAFVPIDKGFPPPHLGRKQTETGTLHFFGLPRAVLEAGSPADRLATDECFEHPRGRVGKGLAGLALSGAQPAQPAAAAGSRRL